MVGLIITAIVSAATLPVLGVQGLAAGNAAGITVLALLLLWGIHRHIGRLDVRAIGSLLLRSGLAAVAAAGCCLALVQLLVERTAPFLALGVGASAMGVLYVVAGRLLKIGEIQQLIGSARDRLGGTGRR
jgi:putative peptidoglycan lipid II flippase